MKRKVRIVIVCLSFGIMTFNTSSSSAQVIAPEKSARAAAASDSRLIASSIANNEDMMFLSQKAIDRSTDERIKELAHQMLTDHTAMLYPMEQLETAGTGSSTKSAGSREEGHQETAALNDRLSRVSGPDFDTMWISNLLVMQQAKYDEYTQAKETVRNPQLKMALTEAIPLLRKHLSQLRSIQKYLAKLDLQKKKEAAKKKAK